MRTEILTIGDELLRGDIVNTNASWLAERLLAVGLLPERVTSIGDELGGLVAELRAIGQRAELVIVSGGLGPTDDDRTAEAAARAANVARTLHEPSLAAIRERFARLGLEMTPNNESQARLPDGAEVLDNPIGTAPGFAMTIGAARMYFLPGVPRELEAIFTREIAPRLQSLGKPLQVRTLRIFRMGESHIDAKLRDLRLADVSLHYQARFPENLLKIIGDAQAVATAETAVRARLGNVVYGIDAQTLPICVGEVLRTRKETVALAESCTGGLIAALLTESPGASDYFHYSAVVYANEMKIRALGVQEATLAREGAVSEACAREMAEGVRRAADTTYGLAVTGIAGPDGGSAEKPVGTVFIAVAGPAETTVHKLFYPGARDQIRRLSAYAALSALLRACQAAHATKRSREN